MGLLWFNCLKTKCLIWQLFTEPQKTVILKTYSQQKDNFKNSTTSTKNKYYENSLVNCTNVSKTCNVFVDY